ncbi:putative F-box protein [Raphanus sativus]|nr:putative F-box protein [Raphanus sativus]
MSNRMQNLYIVNLFTHERIDLPPVEAQHGVTKMERTLDDDVFRITSHDGKEYKGIRRRSPVLWIDEETREYVVLWELRGLCVVYSEKEIPLGIKFLIPQTAVTWFTGTPSFTS